MLGLTGMPAENSKLPVILVVDDDPDLLEMIDQKLHYEGYETVLSLNGEGVREIITRVRPDIVLLDIHMQGVHGGDICHGIKDNPGTCSIPVIIFSGNENIQEIAEDCGADGFIRKPFEGDNFSQTIKRFVPGNTGS